MKIEIHTERFILDEDFWPFIKELNKNGIPVDGKTLLKEKQWSYTTDVCYTKATTTYFIKS
jgi:hypothetical protein